MALSQNFDGGLTDIEMANGLNVYDFDDTFEDERAFEMEYEVRHYLFASDTYLTEMCTYLKRNISLKFTNVFIFCVF